MNKKLISSFIAVLLMAAGPSRGAAASMAAVEGDLGGAMVRIPPGVAELVEFDKEGDGRRQEPRKLRSFGFYALFPEMTALGLVGQERAVVLRSDKSWLLVGVSAGSAYPKTGSKANTVLATKLSEASPYWFSTYARQPGKDRAHLEAYSQVEIPADVPENSIMVRDVYLHRTAEEVDAYVACWRAETAYCHMYLDMQPHMKARVDVRFSVGLLSKWAEIAQGVKKQLIWFQRNAQGEHQPVSRDAR